MSGVTILMDTAVPAPGHFRSACSDQQRVGPLDFNEAASSDSQRTACVVVAMA